MSVPEAEILGATTQAGTTEQRTALRARIVLRAVAESPTLRSLGSLASRSRRSGGDGPAFGSGLAGLADGPRTGGPPIRGREIRERLVSTTLTPPEGSTQWSARRLAKAVGVRPSTILRIWREERLTPRRTETFQLSDPEFVAKLTGVVVLSLAPPERAIVLSVDEKTQIQVLGRTHPILALQPGQAERHTHDYKRHGSLIAALDGRHRLARHKHFGRG